MVEDEEIGQLRERAKELACLYRVNQALRDRSKAPHEVFRQVLKAIPDGWQRPAHTSARIEYLGRQYAEQRFPERGARLVAEIRTWNAVVGHVEVIDRTAETDDAFLREERELLDTIAARLGEYLEWKQQELMGESVGATHLQWRWRQELAERLAAALDGSRFGVRAIYLSGSTERGDAGPGSDIDLVVWFDGTPAQRHDLSLWLEGWGLCLAEVAYRQGGCLVTGGLLDVQWLTREPTVHERVRLRELALAGDVDDE